MLNSDDELLVIEMTIASPPFVIDFAGAYLDIPPDYPDEVLAEWEEEKPPAVRHKLVKVCGFLGRLESFGIYLADVTTNNIRFE